MTMYRQIQDFQESMARLQEALRLGILGNDTRQMDLRSGEAHVIAENLKRDLHGTLSGTGTCTHDRPIVLAAANAIYMAILAAQKEALATNAEELRARLLDFKTYADHADAYFRILAGTEEE